MSVEKAEALFDARAVYRTVIDQSQLEQNQLQQLTMALKQQMLKELRENRSQKKV